MTAAVEAYNCQIVDIPAQATSDILEVLLDRSIDVDGAFAGRADDDLVHIYVGGVEETAALGGCEHRDRIIRPQSTQISALERIDGYVHLGKLPACVVGEITAAHFLADVEHRGLI